MKKDGDTVKGNKYVFKAGSMQMNFIQNNYPKIRGDWTNADDDFVEYEEMEATEASENISNQEEELNYFQTGRLLKGALEGEWFETCRSKKGYTRKWAARLVDELLASEWRDLLARTWGSKKKRESLRGHFVGCLKDAGVLKGTYDSLARAMGYEAEEYRTFSRYLGSGKRQPFFLWIKTYVENNPV